MSAKSGTPSAGSGGRIIAQNAALLDMLREKTLELQRATHVDSVKQEQSSNQSDDAIDDNYRDADAEPSSVNQQRSGSLSGPVQTSANGSAHSRTVLSSKHHSQVSLISSSNGEKQRRFYVESPAFTEEDEHKYKFVNPDIDNESVRSTSSSSRSRFNEPESVDAMPTVAQLAKATSELLESTSIRSDSIHNHSTVKSAPGAKSRDEGEEDMATPRTSGRSISAQPYTVHDCAQHNPSYYNKPDPNQPKEDPFEMLSKIAANRSESAGSYQTPFIEPVRHPLQTIPDEASEEQRLLEEEELYQRQLQQRIKSAQQAAGQEFSIPKLDLDEVGASVSISRAYCSTVIFFRTICFELSYFIGILVIHMIFCIYM